MVVASFLKIRFDDVEFLLSAADFLCQALRPETVLRLAKFLFQPRDLVSPGRDDLALVPVQCRRQIPVEFRCCHLCVRLSSGCSPFVVLYRIM